MPSRIFIALLSMTLLACANYDVKFNDRRVYTPNPLLENKNIADAALSACVSQYIHDNRITHVSQFTELNCPNAAITSVAGLDRFHALKDLNLSNNRISNITALGNLEQLRNLNLSNNRLQNIATLSTLNALRHIALEGNAHLLCQSIRLGKHVSVERPKHCGE